MVAQCFAESLRSLCTERIVGQVQFGQIMDRCQGLNQKLKLNRDQKDSMAKTTHISQGETAITGGASGGEAEVLQAVAFSQNRGDRSSSATSTHIVVEMKSFERRDYAGGHNFCDQFAGLLRQTDVAKIQVLRRKTTTRIVSVRLQVNVSGFIRRYL